MGGGVSTWWATPADPERHFDDHELTTSDRYHDRVRRAGLLAMTARVFLLVVAATVVGRLADHRNASEAWLDDVGWLTAITSSRVLWGTALTIVAVRLPAVVVDGWFEYRFQHGRDDHRPVPLAAFLATTAGLTVGLFVALAAIAGPTYVMIGSIGRWPLLLCVAVVIAVAGFSLVEPQLRRLSGHREQPVEDEALGARMRRLTAPSGLEGIGFATVTSAHDGDLAVPNAYSVGLGANRRVVMTEALLDEPDHIADFVVAHEVTHLAKRHVVIQTAMAVAVGVTVVLAIAALGSAGQPWGWLGYDAGDPLGLPVVGLCVMVIAAALGPLTGWVSRAHERTADAGAMTLVGVPPADEARRLYVATVTDLRPPWWARLYAPHPSPAERLEFLARQRARSDQTR